MKWSRMWVEFECLSPNQLCFFSPTSNEISWAVRGGIDIFIGIVLIKSPWSQSFPGGLKRISGVQDHHFLTSGAGESAGQLQGARFENLSEKTWCFHGWRCWFFRSRSCPRLRGCLPIFFFFTTWPFSILGPINNMSEHLRTMFFWVLKSKKVSYLNLPFLVVFAGVTVIKPSCLVRHRTWKFIAAVVRVHSGTYRIS